MRCTRHPGRICLDSFCSVFASGTMLTRIRRTLDNNYGFIDRTGRSCYLTHGLLSAVSWGPALLLNIISLKLSIQVPTCPGRNQKKGLCTEPGEDSRYLKDIFQGLYFCISSQKQDVDSAAVKCFNTEEPFKYTSQHIVCQRMLFTFPLMLTEYDLQPDVNYRGSPSVGHRDLFQMFGGSRRLTVKHNQQDDVMRSLWSTSMTDWRMLVWTTLLQLSIHLLNNLF